ELRGLRQALMGREGKRPLPFVVTLAPELPGALDLIGRLREGGFIPAIGHTEASYEKAKEAIRAGARHAVHIFNRYPPFHHRSPGAALAALLDEGVSCELIADGLHLHPAAIELIFRIKGSLGMVLVSDSISLAGSGKGEGWVGSKRVILREGRAVTEEGELAGSIMALHEGFVNLVGFLGLSPREVISTATSTPARVLGLEGRKGSLEPGADADLVVLRREDLGLLRTFVKGREVLPQ
ncbi:MAG: N-acetylglucosamine-6-phosphate deacetylase, partial [Nitrospinota bacterium]